RVWVIASLKFLVPFSVLMSLGSALPTFAAAHNDLASSPLDAPALSVTVDRIAEPFTDDVLFPAATTHTAPSTHWTAIVAPAVLACGFVAIVLMRVRGWRPVRAAVRASAPLALVAAGLQPRG